MAFSENINFITPWWFSISPWRIWIAIVWPRFSLKLTGPSIRLERHLHFTSIRLCLALLFIISIIKVYETRCDWKGIKISRILMKKTLKGCGSRLRYSTLLFSSLKQSIFFVVSLLSTLLRTRNPAMYLVVLCTFLVEIHR